MFKSFKDIIKHSAIYSLGNLSTKLIGFILLPFYTTYLTTDQYGILALLEITGQIMVSVFSLNLATGMMRWIAETQDEIIEKSIVFTILISTLIISVLLSFFLIPLSEPISRLFFSTDSFGLYFVLLFISSSLGIYNLVPLTLMRQYEKSLQFTILTTLKFTVTLAFIIYFITELNLGVEGILWGQLIGQGLLTILTIPFIAKHTHPKFKIRIFKEITQYSIPLVFSGVFALSLTMSDRFLIKYFYDNSSVGIYSLGHKIASVINMFILQSFQLGFLPIAYKKLSEKDAKPFFSKVLTYYVFVLTLSALAISMFGKELLELLAQNKDYWAAYYVIPIISLAFVVKGIHYLFSLSFHYTKRTSYNAYIVVATAIFNIALNLILIPKFNYIGGALSLLLSFILMTFLAYIYGQKVYYVKYDFKKLIMIITIGVLCFAGSSFFAEYSFIMRITVKTFLMVLFVLALFFLGLFSKSEIAKLKQVFYGFKTRSTHK